MSALVKLSAKLPGDPEINGLDAIAETFHGDDVVVCIAWLTGREVRRIVATGEEIPVVEVRRIEPIGQIADVPTEVIDLAQEKHAARTGRTPLPFDALEVPKGEADTINDDDDEDDGGEVVTIAGRVDVDEPRVARDPSTIGDIFSFEEREES